MSHPQHYTRRRFLQSAGATAAAGCAAGAPALAASEPAKKPRTHKYEELRPEEFYEELERAPIIYWSTSPVEEHGLHNPLGADFFQSYEICLRAVEISGGIVLPEVPVGPSGRLTRAELRSGTKRLYPPTLCISRETCKLVYTELLETMADLKFKVCIGIGGHGPCDWVLKEMV